jgi:hypothetical protein
VTVKLAFQLTFRFLVRFNLFGLRPKNSKVNQKLKVKKLYLSDCIKMPSERPLQRFNLNQPEVLPFTSGSGLPDRTLLATSSRTLFIFPRT